MKRMVACVVLICAVLGATTASGQHVPTPVEILAAQVNHLSARVTLLEIQAAVSATHIGADRPVPADYDGDGKSDAAVFRPGTGVWHVKYSGGGTLDVQWGISTDTVAPGDYDGDGLADLGVYRPSNGVLYIRYATGATAGIQMRAQ